LRFSSERPDDASLLTKWSMLGPVACLAALCWMAHIADAADRHQHPAHSPGTPRFDSGATGDAIPRQGAMDSMRDRRPFGDGSVHGAGDCQRPLANSHGEAIVQLHAACLIAVQHDSAEPRIAYSAAEYELVWSAVGRFVARCRTDDLPPERILMLLKRALNDKRSAIGQERQEDLLRGIILEAFLHAYYGGAQSV